MLLWVVRCLLVLLFQVPTDQFDLVPILILISQVTVLDVRQGRWFVLGLFGWVAVSGYRDNILDQRLDRLDRFGMRNVIQIFVLWMRNVICTRRR